MQAVALGLIQVATPGTPVPIAATRTLCNRFPFETTTTGIGKAYLGLAGMVKSTFGVINEYRAAGAGAPDAFDVLCPDGANELDVSQYFVDAANAAEGLIVTYWVRLGAPGRFEAAP